MADPDWPRVCIELHIHGLVNPRHTRDQLESDLQGLLADSWEERVSVVVTSAHIESTTKET